MMKESCLRRSLASLVWSWAHLCIKEKANPDHLLFVLPTQAEPVDMPQQGLAGAMSYVEKLLAASP